MLLRCGKEHGKYTMTPLLPERLVHVSAMFDKRYREAFYLDSVFMGPAALAELDKQFDAE